MSEEFGISDARLETQWHTGRARRAECTYRENRNQTPDPHHSRVRQSQHPQRCVLRIGVCAQKCVRFDWRTGLACRRTEGPQAKDQRADCAPSVANNCKGADGLAWSGNDRLSDQSMPSTGRAMAGLLAGFAEFERAILRDRARARAGLAHARLNGKDLGRTPSAASWPNRNPDSSGPTQRTRCASLSSRSQVSSWLGT